MPSEIKQLLVQIEEEHLACRRGYNGLVAMTRVEYDERQQKIHTHHGRLLELVGDKATTFVDETFRSADLLFERELMLFYKDQARRAKEGSHANI